MDNSAQNDDSVTNQSSENTISQEEQNTSNNTFDALKTSAAYEEQQTSASGASAGDSKPTTSQIQKLDDKIKSVSLPQELHEKVVAMVDRLRLISNDSSFFIELDSTSRYIDWVTNLPWGQKSEDILNLAHVKEVLDKNHYGLTEVKSKILEYLAVMIMRKEMAKTSGNSIFSRAPIISLVGLAGVGKTSVAYSIAEALGRKIERIPFGGMGSATQLRGKTRLFADSEPGLIIKALKRCKTENPVILLDEIDRVSEDARGDIMGVLVELLDPEQNSAFTDHFIDFPVNLSNVLFIATSNNTKDISTAVLDRLEIVQMPSYSDTEKTMIGKQFILPKSLSESGMTSDNLVFDEAVWEDFVIRPLGYDPGLRSLQRVVNGVVRKVAYNMLTGVLPRDKQFVLNAQNVKEYVEQW